MKINVNLYLKPLKSEAKKIPRLSYNHFISFPNTFKVAYYSFMRVQEVYTINVQI